MSLRERSLRRCGFWVLSLLSCIDPEGNFASLWFASLLLSFLVLTCNWEEAMGVRKGEEGSSRKRDFFLQWRRTDISLQKRKNTSVPPQFLNTSKFITEKECLWLSGSLSTQAPMNSGHCEMCPGSRNFVFPVGKGEMPAGKILLVEDTEINRILLRKVFRDLNLLFEEAENGQIAVDYFKQGKNYDLVLMDKEMPVMDGHEATRQLRLLGVKTPIIALTGNSLQSDKELFFQAGANEFRTKPLSRDELMWLLARYGLECRQPSSMLQP